MAATVDAARVPNGTEVRDPFPTNAVKQFYLMGQGKGSEFQRVALEMNSIGYHVVGGAVRSWTIGRRQLQISCPA